MTNLQKASYLLISGLLALLINYLFAKFLQELQPLTLSLETQLQIVGAVLFSGITVSAFGALLPKKYFSNAEEEIIQIGVISSFLGSLLSVLGFGIMLPAFDGYWFVFWPAKIVTHFGLTSMFFGISFLVIEGTKGQCRILKKIVKN